MTLKQSLERVNHGIKTVPDQTPAAPTPEDEARQIAREAVQAFAEELETYRRLKDREPNRDNPRDSPDWRIERILNAPPEEVTFFDIECLSREDKDRALARWEEVKATARRDLDTGFAAARALEYMGGSAWQRANFHAIRERLFQAWSPRHAGEAMLLEEMAQYEMIRRQWVGILSLWSRDPKIQLSLRNPDYMRPEKRDINAALANQEAMRMIERLQKLYQNALRTLLNSRRGKSAFIVQRSGQINVTAGPQMNACVSTSDDQKETT
jgi:hypothetical protein